MNVRITGANLVDRITGAKLVDRITGPNFVVKSYSVIGVCVVSLIKNQFNLALSSARTLLYPSVAGALNSVARTRLTANYTELTSTMNNRYLHNR